MDRRLYFPATKKINSVSGKSYKIFFLNMDLFLKSLVGAANMVLPFKGYSLDSTGKLVNPMHFTGKALKLGLSMKV